MFEITGDTILAGARQAAREQGLDPVDQGGPAAEASTVFEVRAVNCYRQPLALDGQLHEGRMVVTGQQQLGTALAAKTGLFTTAEGGTERHRTFEFAVTDTTTGTVQHYRRTRGGLERVDAPPVSI
jgi:hypothetical protein